MSAAEIKAALKATVVTLAVIWGLNQIDATRNLVQRALTGN